MLEILSDPNWLAPQIDILLKLQDLRIHSPEFVTKIMLLITQLGELAIPALIASICYWCISFDLGMYLFCLMGFHFITSTTLKMFACVYRPWVLSDKIKPVSEAIAFAKGYSFPSGHSSMVASLFGGIAFGVQRHLLFSIVLILTIFAVGFSRLWLGVHTPQDVIVGLVLGFVLVFIVSIVLDWVEADKKRYLYFLLFTNLISIALLIYFCMFRQYPMDYINGELLVNPLGPLRAQVVCVAFSLGIINGVCITRNFFKFDPKEGSVFEKFIRAFVGVLFILILNHYCVEYCFSDKCPLFHAFFITLFVGLFISAIYPFIFTKIGNLLRK